MIDFFQEIWSTIRKNKLRTFLTGFSIAWGIFMLILLLGAGNGLQNGILRNFGGKALNSMFIWPGRTSMPFEGLQKGRVIKFDDRSVETLKNEQSQISNITPTIDRWGVTLSYGKEYVTPSLVGVAPGFMNIKKMEIKAGRFINETDMKENRKVIVLNEKTANLLFNNGSPLNRYVTANRVAYQVVGIYTDDEKRTSPDVYIPFTTAQIIYNQKQGYNSIQLTVDNITSIEEGEALTKAVKTTLGKVHSFQPDDYQAIYIWNVIENYLQNLSIFNSINLFVWIIGIGTLIAGIVGVSNIMLITVKERTREFGIRKALGATPISILKLVIIEAIVITAFFGYIGMIIGIGVTEIANIFVEKAAQDDFSVFYNPTVQLSIITSATALLIIAGVIAGYFPARKAVKIKPIEALRNE